MDLMLLRVFQRQLELQCRFMILAAQDVNQGLKNKDVYYTFYAIQNLLSAGANISKTLWGTRGAKSAERAPLRDSIGIMDDSPLRAVTMRNNFEHMDERIERWWGDSKHHNHSDLNISSRSGIAGIEKIDWFRHFDPQTTDLTFWGEDFNLQALISEAQRILPKLQEEAHKPHWEAGGSKGR